MAGVVVREILLHQRVASRTTARVRDLPAARPGSIGTPYHLTSALDPSLPGKRDRGRSRTAALPRPVRVAILAGVFALSLPLSIVVSAQRSVTRAPQTAQRAPMVASAANASGDVTIEPSDTLPVTERGGR